MSVSDPILGSTQADRCWTLTNVAEATPLVLTALEWDIWSESVELGARGAWHDFGFLPTSAVRRSPDQNELITGIFYGRQAMNVDLTREIMGMIPGSSADDYERDVLGSLRPEAKPIVDSYRRVPVIAAKMPAVLIRHRREVEARHGEQLAWWRDRVLRAPTDSDPRALLAESARRFVETMRIHVRSRTLLQGLQAQISTMCTTAGCPDLVHGLLSGYGGVTEVSIADDLWRISRGEVDVAAFIARHGFHGPNEGNLTSRVWRETPTVVDALAASAGRRSAEDAPRAREARAIAQREAAEAELLARLGRIGTRLAPFLLRSAGAQVRNLELGKAAYVAAVDGCRAAARLLGAEMAAAHHIDDPEDIFHLTWDELLGEPIGLSDLARERRKTHAEYRSLDIPVTFTGMPEPLLETNGDGRSESEGIIGVTGAPGRVEGTVRVVLDPDDAEDLDEGEILVCRMTDPSWAALFSLAAGLVIDIGGPSSHGAIVARELGVPCVIGTGDGTRVLKTGERVVVDGDSGKVTRLGSS